MTAPTVEKAPENLAADTWYAADEPDPADDAAGPEAPYGWMTDPETGEQRPKKAPGRPRKPPTAEELAGAPPLPREPDVPPKPPGRKRAKPKAGQPAEEPMPEDGWIARGVNRTYRRIGKGVRGLDYDIGQAIIDCTRPEDEDDITVGQAWEELCKTNPRVRRFVLNALRGGAMWDLAMAHAPIAGAIFMKPFIQRLIPWGRIVESVAEPDEDTAPGEGGLPGGMTADDAEQVADLVSAQARQMAERAARAAGVEVSEAEMAEAVARAEAMMGGGGLPAGLRRQQPKRTTRAQRTSR